MRIGLYVESGRDKELRGVGYHVLNLVRAIARADRRNEYLLYYQRGPFERNDGWEHCPTQPNFQARPVTFPADWTTSRPGLWLKHVLPWAIGRDRVDVFHSPNHFLPALTSTPMVVTIHDVAYFKMQLYDAAMNDALCRLTLDALARANRVIAISQSTWKDLEGLAVDQNKLRLVYNGSGEIVAEDRIQYHRVDEFRRRFNLPERYILFVGTVGLRKNLPFLLRSFAALKNTTAIPQKLVLVGKKLAGIDELDRLSRDLGIADDVIMTGYVEAWHVPLFYKLADLFVLPTLYEGFGLITLEAMAYGIPVIATDTSSIREVSGDAAALVRVNDVDALARAMRDVLSDEALRRSMVERGRLRPPQFTWDRAARETVAVYEELAEARAAIA